MQKVLILIIPALLLGTFQARADETTPSKLASVTYVEKIVDALSVTVNAHVNNKNNPHEVTAAQVGLGGLVNEDGIVNIDRLPVGTSSTTVAVGDDKRFDSVTTMAPAGTAIPPENRAFVWFD